MKTKLHLKDEFKFSLIVIVMLIVCIVVLNKTDEQFIKDCTSTGYSRNYCERHG